MPSPPPEPRPVSLKALREQLQEISRIRQAYEQGGLSLDTVEEAEEALLDTMREQWPSLLAFAEAAPEFMQHKPECHYWQRPRPRDTYRCDCGLDAALALAPGGEDDNAQP